MIRFRRGSLVLAAVLAIPFAGVTAQQDNKTNMTQSVVVTVLSSQPQMVTGSDALVRLELANPKDIHRVHATLNNTDVTSVFRQDGKQPRLTGLVKGLTVGENTLTASIGKSAPVKLTITDYPITGPVFSGPHEQPFLCDTDRFKMPDGNTLGQPLDADCSTTTRVDYYYRSTAGGKLKPLADPKTLPDDIAQATTLLGATTPYIVRVETGTVNRAIYQIAVLHNPAKEQAPDFVTKPAAWNGRLIYTFGGGCFGGYYHQGATTGGIDEDVMLKQGYAVAAASLDVFGNNCNDVLSAETMMMVKERFVKAYGPPMFTIGWGCSGGSMQVYEIGDNYPGLLDGFVAGCSFPDANSAIAVHSFGARMLYHYFQSTPTHWTQDQEVAVSGLPNFDTLFVQGTRTAWTNPTGDCYAEMPADTRYSAIDRPQAARCDVYDHAVNIYGKDPQTGFARRILDNVGIQYGLAPLNDGKISKEQFLDLNAKIGGMDADTNFVPQRTVADAQAINVAYRTGRFVNGGGGLSAMPIIDYRAYADYSKGDPHMRFYSFSTRERLIRANGTADNQVIIVENNSHGLFSLTSPVLQGALLSMDQWLVNLQKTNSSAPQLQKVIQAKPSDLVDACFDDKGEKIVEKQTFDGPGACNKAYPSHAAPHLMAGMPLADDVIKCQLKPINEADYKVTFTSQELEQLHRIFPDGVCDYSKPGVGQAPLKGTWLSFGPSPVNLVDITNP